MWKEAVALARALRDRVQADPARLEAIEARLDTIARLTRKYGDSVAGIQRFRDDLAGRLDRLAHHEELMASMERQLERTADEARGAALALGSGRGASPPGESARVRQARIGLSDHYGGSMPSGWIRWLLEQMEVPFTVVYPGRLDAGDLAKDFDVLVFPDGGIPAGSEREAIAAQFGGRQPAAADLPEEYRDRLGRVSVDKTVPQLKAFLEAGGTVITIGRSTALAHHLKLPVDDYMVERTSDGRGRSLPREKFYVPASLLLVGGHHGTGGMGTRCQHHRDTHAGARAVRAEIGAEAWRSYFKCAFARNPWDRFLSLYHWHYRRPARRARQLTPSEFIGHPRTRRLNDNGWGVYTIDGAVAVDRVCRYEDLAAELAFLQQRLGLRAPLVMPRTKHTSRGDRRPYREVLSADDARRIGEIFADEIALMGYAF